MPPSLQLILGPVLIGTVVNVFLMGIMVVQCYLYYLWYKQDRLVIKLTVYFLLFLDLVRSGFDVAMCYQYLVLAFGNLVNIGVVNIGITPYPMLSGLTTLIVQAFFGWRVSILTKTRLFGVIICTLSVVQFLASIGTTIGGVMVHELAELSKLQPVALVWLVVGAATDILITLLLVYQLRSRQTGYARTDDLISKIVRVTVQTGFLTSACAISVVLAYLLSESSLHLAFGIPLSKLYTNSLVSTLNMRHSWNMTGYSNTILPGGSSQSASGGGARGGLVSLSTPMTDETLPHGSRSHELDKIFTGSGADSGVGKPRMVQGPLAKDGMGGVHVTTTTTMKLDFEGDSV